MFYDSVYVLCHSTWKNVPNSGRPYHDLNFHGSLSSVVRWDCFSSLCFSFCSVVWETPSNQYNHHLRIQPSQERELFISAGLMSDACRNNLSPSLWCPICQLTDKAQMSLTCQFWCEQLFFICTHIPCRGKGSIKNKQTKKKNQMARFLRS